MRRFRALIKKELTHMLRDPRTLVFVFMMPVLQLVLLGYVNNTDFTNIPTAVDNEDGSPASRQLLDAFKSTGYFTYDFTAYSQNEVNTLIAGGQAKVGIVIPSDYSQNLNSGHTADVLVLLDGSDPTIASAALSAAQLAGQAHGASVRAQELTLQGASLSATTPIDVRTNVL